MTTDKSLIDVSGNSNRGTFMKSILALQGGTPVRKTPFTRWPYYDSKEKLALNRALDQGQWWRMSGKEVEMFECEFAEFTEALGGALAVTNGTHALEIALLTLGIGQGDEVIVPAFTFISTSMAVQRIGATAIPIDVDLSNYCIQLDAIKAAMTPKTKAVIPVHMAGHAVDLKAFEHYLIDRGIYIIQDACHAHGAKSHGKKMGKWRSIACYSFQNYKLMTAGEGGILTFPTSELRKKAFLLHNCGRHSHDRNYLHEFSGSNYRMNEFAGAILRVQLERLADQNQKREENVALLKKMLLEIPGIVFQGREKFVQIHPHYMVMFLVCPKTYPNLKRDYIVDALIAEGIPAFKNYKPIYKTKAFWQSPSPKQSQAFFEKTCVNTEKISAHGIWIHHSALLGNAEDVNDIATALRKVLNVE